MIYDNSNRKRLLHGADCPHYGGMMPDAVESVTTKIKRIEFKIMNQTVLFTIIILVIVFTVTVSSYFHKRHLEYKMSDIEKAVKGSFPKGVDSITKQDLVKGIKKYFHCSAKEAHYIIGVARRKKLVDIAADFVTLL